MKFSHIMTILCVLLVLGIFLTWFAITNSTEEKYDYSEILAKIIPAEETTAPDIFIDQPVYPVPTPDIPYVPVASYVPATPAVPVEINPFTNETYLGMSMHDTWEIQNALRNLGYNVPLDGKYEMETDSAVRMFQKRWGLAVDGIAGVNTQKMLGLEGKMHGFGWDFSFRPLAGAGTTTRVALLKDYRRVYVYRWDEMVGWTIGLETEAMIGAPGKDTPSGDFKIIDASESGFVKNGKWYKYMMTFCVPDGDWSGAYGFHTVALDLSGIVFRSVEEENERNVTSGCVRLDLDAAKWIYENVPVGSDVRIY